MGSQFPAHFFSFYRAVPVGTFSSRPRPAVLYSLHSRPVSSSSPAAEEQQEQPVNHLSCPTPPYPSLSRGPSPPIDWPQPPAAAKAGMGEEGGGGAGTDGGLPLFSSAPATLFAIFAFASIHPSAVLIPPFLPSSSPRAAFSVIAGLCAPRSPYLSADSSFLSLSSHPLLLLLVWQLTFPSAASRGSRAAVPLSSAANT